MSITCTVYPIGEQHLNTSNINNTTTALKISNYICISIFLTYNTGVYGWKKSSYHTSIYLTGSLRLERNKAIIGGAINIAGNLWILYYTWMNN